MVTPEDVLDQSQLLEMIHKISYSNSLGNETKIVFLDISKAFDRVWHKGLIFKLSRTGIPNSLLKWFESYLSNRSQRVIIRGNTSDWNFINCGMPQGSV